MEVKSLKLKIAFLLVIITTSSWGQMESRSPELYFVSEGAVKALSPTVTQSELKKGWDIQGVNVGRKTVRYISGKEAVLITSGSPIFHIYTKGQLNDYVIIKLLNRKGYRLFTHSTLQEGKFLSIDIHHFKIENLPDMGFAVTPIKPLTSGNYVLVNLNTEPVNEYGDREVYEFTVE